jgi:hypothetical protein
MKNSLADDVSGGQLREISGQSLQRFPNNLHLEGSIYITVCGENSSFISLSH